jgi:hypothetical protein
MKAYSTVGIQQALTSNNNPKGNAATERVMQTLAEAGLWLQKWTRPFTRMRGPEVWIADYNEPYLHSALGCQSRRQFEQHESLSHGTPFVAA